jgi:hypothetical protein
MGLLWLSAYFLRRAQGISVVSFELVGDHLRLSVILGIVPHLSKFSVNVGPAHLFQSTSESLDKQFIETACIGATLFDKFASFLIQATGESYRGCLRA